MDFRTRKYYYNRCIPYEPLKPEDERNLDIDAFGEHRVRGINWADMLVSEISLSNAPVCKFFTGLPGSGKSTELLRLARRLTDEANLFPIVINAEDMIDLSSEIEVTDIISAVVYGTEKEIRTKQGQVIDKEGYLERLWTWLKETDIELGKAELSVLKAGKLVFEMKDRPNLRRRVRSAIAAHFSRFIQKACEELILLNEEVRRDFDYEGIVIIFDSLEKLRGITANWQEVLESAEKVFSGSAPYLQLPVHVIYTIPPALTTRIKADISYLPMIKVRDKEKQEYAEGISAAREFIRKRIPDDIIEELFGEDAEKKLKELILWSGGYPREIVQMLQKVIAQKTHPILDKDFNHIIKDLTNQYRSFVPGEAFKWLAELSKTKFLTVENDDHRRNADQMLSNHAVLRYLNDELWHELHPAVYEIPGVQQAIRDLEAGQNVCEE